MSRSSVSERSTSSQRRLQRLARSPSYACSRESSKIGERERVGDVHEEDLHWYAAAKVAVDSFDPCRNSHPGFFLNVNDADHVGNFVDEVWRACLHHRAIRVQGASTGDFLGRKVGRLAIVANWPRKVDEVSTTLATQ